MKTRHAFTIGIVFAAALFGFFSITHSEEMSLKFRLKPGANGKLCLNCHPGFEDKLKKAYVHTPVKKGECSGCHNPHTSSHGKLLAASAGKICLACHGGLVDKKARSIHKAVIEGSCVKCHDSHGSDNKASLLKAGNELCYGCHKEMGESLTKVKFKHNPVEKGCLNCHDPHASDRFPKLLKNGVPELCTSCHKTDRPAFLQRHMNYPVAKSNCTSCHDPHGSDRAGILYATVHVPVANKMCNQCHEDSTSPTPLKVKKGGIDLCRGCHSTMVNEMLAKNRIHWPVLAKDGCLSCHNPHAAPAKGLLKGTMATLCYSCHQDTSKRHERSETKHKPIAEGQCTACHSPHGSDTPFLAKQDSVIDLCGTCHDWQKHSSHPLGEKFKDPRNKNLTIQCLSCHRSHGTEYKHLMPFATPTELCTQCHEKFKR